MSTLAFTGDMARLQQAIAESHNLVLESEVAGSRIRTWHLMPTERMGPPPGASPRVKPVG
jgi:hypothetical protein